jgi:transcriptional regulator with XRE-family HTH domain
MSVRHSPIGGHLRAWRQRRRLSQLDLALDAEISARHLSFLETGRAQPSREMILHLAGQLDVPIRDRNQLLVAAGYAPVFPERPLHDPALAAVNGAIAQVLERHKPYPAYALDRHWNIVASNSALPELFEGVAPELLTPPVNTIRLSLHPQGLAPRIVNFAQWRRHSLERLARQVELTTDPVLAALQREVLAYPAGEAAGDDDTNDVITTFRLRTSLGLLSFLTTTMVFGMPVDVTCSELAVELFFPADDETAAIVARRPS